MESMSVPARSPWERFRSSGGIVVLVDAVSCLLNNIIGFVVITTVAMFFSLYTTLPSCCQDFRMKQTLQIERCPTTSIGKYILDCASMSK
jgi:hypothetical protein